MNMNIFSKIFSINIYYKRLLRNATFVIFDKVKKFVLSSNFDSKWDSYRININKITIVTQKLINIDFHFFLPTLYDKF